MREPALTNRESLILKSLVMTFVESAAPVSSRYLSKVHNNRLSAATIRNVMMDLEDKFLVAQPHTSAGRIPTDLGYRYYVDDLMMIESLSHDEKQKIDHGLHNVNNEDVEAILEKSCEVLSKISNQLGIILTPKFYQGKFKKLELISLSETKLLVIISISSGLVKTVMLEINSKIPRNKLEQTSQVLNERLSGLSLRQIRDSIKNRMKDVSYGDEELIFQLTESADKIFSIQNDHLHFKGAQNILSQPEFSDQERIKKILELIDNQKVLIHIINNTTSTDEKISITIGNENKEQIVNKCSLVTASYKIGGVTSTLGIIGPTRMKYEKVTSLVDYLSKTLGRLFS